MLAIHTNLHPWRKTERGKHMEFSFKMKVNATKEKIWEFYADVQKWYTWEDDLEDISLNGKFETGATGVMKLADMPPLEYTLTKVIQNQRFCDRTPTPFGDVFFDHQILEEADSVHIKHTVRLDTQEITTEKLGFLRQIFADVPNSIMALKVEVEK